MHESFPALGVADKSELRKVGDWWGANKRVVAQTAWTSPKQALWADLREL
jgi:hypothetical protein